MTQIHSKITKYIVVASFSFYLGTVFTEIFSDSKKHAGEYLPTQNRLADNTLSAYTDTELKTIAKHLNAMMKQDFEYLISKAVKPNSDSNNPTLEQYSEVLQSTPSKHNLPSNGDNTVPPSSFYEQQATHEEALLAADRIYQSALTLGEWGKSERQEFSMATKNLTTQERFSVMKKVALAINNGELEVNLETPIF
jgi:hypothetical protein